MNTRFLVPIVLLLGSTALAPLAGQTVSPSATSPSPKRPVARTATIAKGYAPLPIPYSKFTLPNGLTVIVNEDHKTPIVAVGIWYHVGSANETPGRTGFAHLFEHLMFNGSQHANTDWFEEMNEVGASNMNGSTDFDTTKYYQVVPTVALDRVLWLESDRMENLLPAVDQARLDEQRKVVQNEKRQRENGPLGSLVDVLLHGSFPEGHPYSWAPIGSMEDLNAASLDDVKRFFNKWYRPNNAVVVLSGDITVAQAREKVERYFGNIPAGPLLDRTRDWIARRTGASRAQMDVQSANPNIFKFWNAPGAASAEVPLLSIAAETMGGGSTSFLHKRLVLERRLASEVKASFQTMERASFFQVVATALPGVSSAQLEAALDEEIAAYLRTGPTAAEVERLKLDRFAGTLRRQTSTLDKAIRLVEGEMFAGTPDHDGAEQQRLYDATPARVLAAARTWLSDGAFVIETKPVPEFKTSGTPVDRGVKPVIGPMADFTLPALQHATLSNGVAVALAERHDLPTVAMSMFLDVGSLPDRDPASTGLSTALQMSMMGTRSRTKEEITNELQGLGASVGWEVAQEDSRLNMNALKSNLDATLDIYADILKNPTIPDKEWSITVANSIAAYEDDIRSNAGKLKRLAPRVMYGADHPYAARLTPETLRRITAGDLRRFYARWVRPEKATILIVGDTTMAEMLPKLEQRLGDWKAPAGPVPSKAPLSAPVPPAAPRVVLIDQPGAKSTIIKVVQTSVRRGDPDFEALNLVNAIVGGQFMSRLNMNLREQKGWSYGASSSLNSAPRIGTIEAGGSVQADKTAEAMREIDRELREIGTTRLPTDAEITTAKNALLLRMPALLESPGGTMGFLKDTYAYGLPEDYWNGYISRVRALTPDQVRAAARRLFRPRAFSWIVVGDLAAIEADVRKLGLGAVEVVDAEGKRLR